MDKKQDREWIVYYRAISLGMATVTAPTEDEARQKFSSGDVDTDETLESTVDEVLGVMETGQ